MKAVLTLAIAFICMATVGMITTDALAKRVAIAGTHSFGSIKKKCPGCDCWNNAGGFGCENKKKETGVYCTTKGKVHRPRSRLAFSAVI